MQAIRNPNLGPSQMRARRRRLFYIRTCIILFFLGVLIITLAIFSGHEKLKIKDIRISGQAVVSADDITAIVNRDLSGRYGYLFARSNSLIFPRFQIKKDLLREIKVIKDLTVSWVDWQAIEIAISERRPDSAWCGAEPEDKRAECFFVDKTGYIYGPAPDFSGNIFIRNYGGVASSSEPVGQYFLTPEIYTQIYDLLAVLDEKNLKVIAVSFDGSIYKFFLEAGPQIVFNDQNPFTLSFDNLFSALETKNLNWEKDQSVINYIDLRFDDKIVVGKK